MKTDVTSRLAGILAVILLLAGCAAPVTTTATAEKSDYDRAFARLWRSMCIEVSKDVPAVVQARDEGFEFELVRDMAVVRVTEELASERPEAGTPAEAERFDSIEDTVIKLTAMMVMRVFTPPHLDVESERQSWTETCINLLDR
jgi:hypothetical protein